MAITKEGKKATQFYSVWTYRIRQPSPHLLKGVQAGGIYWIAPLRARMVTDGYRPDSLGGVPVRPRFVWQNMGGRRPNPRLQIQPMQRKKVSQAPFPLYLASRGGPAQGQAPGVCRRKKEIKKKNNPAPSHLWGSPRLAVHTKALSITSPLAKTRGALWLPERCRGLGEGT